MRGLLRQIVTATALCAALGVAQAQEFNPGEPIKITSRTSSINETNGAATYAGDVSAMQGSLVFEADKLTVFYAGGKVPAVGDFVPADQVTRIEGAGGVFVTFNDQVGSANAVVYDLKAKTITLIGNARATQGDNVTTGSRVMFNIATGVTPVGPEQRGDLPAAVQPAAPGVLR
ncbi:lipopolysaccharide export system protein LptA [Variibacter gotjawalensis]|nr:lipopolysaccharide export system protein LptA [Variibacter gotjawalensis]